MDHSKAFTDRIEETLIAGILGAMTLITFANVVTRYGFNQNILWALELTVFLRKEPPAPSQAMTISSGFIARQSFCKIPRKPL